MRWLQFLLTLVNLGFSIYLILENVFFTNKVNPATFLWTLIHLSLALAISHLYMLYMSNKIDDWYDVESMRGITNLSIVSLTICTIALSIQIGLEYYNNKRFLNTDPESIKQISPLVAALICSIVLFSSSIKFKKYVLLCRSVDLKTTQSSVASPRRNYRTTDLN